MVWVAYGLRCRSSRRSRRSACLPGLDDSVIGRGNAARHNFLFSLNRINLALSRAKGPALVFGAPRLRETNCETVEKMRLVNTLCALTALAEIKEAS